MKTMTFRDALTKTLDEAMDRDPTVFLFGEDIGPLGGAFQVTKGLWKKYGTRRVRTTPISEAAILGTALGAACTGLKPVAEIMFCDFLYMGMDVMVNQIPKMKYMFGGKAVLPIVVRTSYGAGLSSAAQHAQSNEAMFTHIAGWKVVMPSTPQDARGLLRSAIDDPNPVLFYEHHCLYDTTGPVPDGDYKIPLGVADVKREGTDVTIVATGLMVHRSLEAAEELSKEGISAEVVDPRTLNPLDIETILRSVRKTRKAVVVHEAPKTGGIGAEISAQIAESAFECLDAPVIRVCGKDTPLPFSPVLEKFVLPQKADIVSAARSAVHQTRINT
jgi:acetoin:2,6-dichlorophenolindophenol oxidoreductase subunit beta